MLGVRHGLGGGAESGVGFDHVYEPQGWELSGGREGGWAQEDMDCEGADYGCLPGLEGAHSMCDADERQSGWGTMSGHGAWGASSSGDAGASAPGGRRCRFDTCTLQIGVDELDISIQERRSGSPRSTSSSEWGSEGAYGEDVLERHTSASGALTKTEDGPKPESKTLDFLVHKYFESDEIRSPRDVERLLGAAATDGGWLVVAGRLQRALSVLESEGRVAILPSSVRLSEAHLPGLRELTSFAMSAACGA